MNRRDLLLQEMQISQWQLTKPQVLKGDAQIQLSNAVKLVVICEENPYEYRFFHDVLRALGLFPQQSQWFTAEQATRLNISHSVLIWLILPESQGGEKIRLFAKFSPWHTPSWQALQQPDAKRQFWQQIEPFCQPFNEK
ncbi:MAG: DNA polymerase III subunit psi [Pasteurellaceae bacterium]|nr:DNA polymerase III subunit psi [Pasteurellaceae bacterium]